jgi:hypothetical protein
MNIYFFSFYSLHIPDTISLLYVHPFLPMHSPSHISHRSSSHASSSASPWHFNLAARASLRLSLACPD